MTCKQFRTLLEEEPVRTPAMRAHAEGCARCAAAAREADALREALRAWPDAEAPAGLAERALQLCLAETERPAPVRRGRRTPLWMVFPALAAGALAVTVLQVRPVLTVPKDAPAMVQRDPESGWRALRRAAVRVSMAEERSRSVLARVARWSDLGKE